MGKKKEAINGIIDGSKVKAIFDEQASGRKQWFAKPKEFDINTIHFEENHGVLSVHQDSPDGLYYRGMTPEIVCSGAYQAGRTLCEKKDSGLELVILPMQPSAHGFVIDSTSDGSSVNLPSDGWCLMALGTWGQWQRKSKTT